MNIKALHLAMQGLWPAGAYEEGRQLLCVRVLPGHQARRQVRRQETWRRSAGSKRRVHEGERHAKVRIVWQPWPALLPQDKERYASTWSCEADILCAAAHSAQQHTGSSRSEHGRVFLHFGLKGAPRSCWPVVLQGYVQICDNRSYQFDKFADHGYYGKNGCLQGADFTQKCAKGMCKFGKPPKKGTPPPRKGCNLYVGPLEIFSVPCAIFPFA